MLQYRRQTSNISKNRYSRDTVPERLGQIEREHAQIALEQLPEEVVDEDLMSEFISGGVNMISVPPTRNVQNAQSNALFPKLRNFVERRILSTISFNESPS